MRRTAVQASTGGCTRRHHGCPRPAACAVADKVLEITEREDLVTHAREVGEKLSGALEPLEGHPNVAEVFKTKLAKPFKEIQRRIEKKILLQSDSSLHQEVFRLKALRRLQGKRIARPPPP